MIVELADAVGICAFALSGFLVGVRERLDLLGIFLAAFLSALGGGVCRDVIVGRDPYSFVHLLPSLLVVGTVAAGFLFKLQRKEGMEEKRLFLWSDAAGLASFSVAGALVALDAGYNLFGTVLLAFLTAVGGGIVRDILLNRVPLVLTHQFYGSVAILVGAALYGAWWLEIDGEWSSVVVFSGGLFLRLWAHYRGWSLPKVG